MGERLAVAFDLVGTVAGGAGPGGWAFLSAVAAHDLVWLSRLDAAAG
jgi:hypothetical protein